MYALDRATLMDTKVTMGKVADHCERLIREKDA